MVNSLYALQASYDHHWCHHFHVKRDINSFLDRMLLLFLVNNIKGFLLSFEMLIAIGFAFCAIGAGVIIIALNKRKQILIKAQADANKRIAQATAYANKKVAQAKADVDSIISKAEGRVDRLKETDKEIVYRLKQSRELIDQITDKGCKYAADIELLTEDELVSSQGYQEDRKDIKVRLKKLAINAIDGFKGSNADVNVDKFIAISAKADMAGALLLTTVEMLCNKVSANNGHQASEKLAESIVATEALIKAIDSRAFLNSVFKSLLLKRLEIEINFKKAKQLAKDQQKEIRDQEREEKKVRQEAERLRKDAEKEERIKSEAISDLERQMADKTDAERLAFQEELDQLKLELQAAHDRLERARSRAQETKQGHVYIISNIGSFGEEILKIGMTRRLEPMDRVKELGDASVPFTFDVHALIESDDAPNLESTLHQVFDSRRVNKVNRRKEYFKVNLEDIEKELESLGVKALINKVPSADEYYQSVKMENEAA